MTYPSLKDTGHDPIHEQARVRGHAAGYAAGVAEGTRLLDRERAAAVETRAAAARAAAARTEYVLSVLQSAGEAMFSRAAPVLDGMDAALTEAALQLAEAVLGHELAGGEASARSALARATPAAAPAPVHTVRMNPEDLAVLTEADREAAGVRLVPDPAMRRGDAVAEYADGFLDARLSTALDRMRRALTGGLQ